MRHLPGIVLYGSPTVNSYKRFEAQSFAPTTAIVGRRQPHRRRALAARDADGLPHRAAHRRGRRAAALGHRGACWPRSPRASRAPLDPGEKGQGNLYGVGEPLPKTLFDAVQASRADETIVEILGEDAVYDYGVIALAEWERFCLDVTDWDRERYLRLV